MKIFIWQRINDITSNYHSDAGVVVIAPTQEQAREEVRQYAEYNDHNINIPEPDFTHELGPGIDNPQMWVFPDAGCC